MNDEDIAQFMNAFEDFMKHSEREIHSYQQWGEAREYTKRFYEKQAAELDVSVEYYIQEFV